MQSPLHNMDQYCVFQAADAVWAVSAASAREVADIVPIVRVPDVPALVVGLCQLRTELLPVLDLQRLVGETSESTGDAKYLLVLNGSEGAWAIPIQRALSLQPLEIAISSTRDSQLRSSMVLGTATFRNEVIRVADASVMYRCAIRALDAHWSPEVEIECDPSQSLASVSAG